MENDELSIILGLKMGFDLSIDSMQQKKDCIHSNSWKGFS